MYVEPTPGLALDGVQILNVYPYSREGEPLFDVLFYDENSRPVSILSGLDDTSRRILADENGTQVFNSFPIRLLRSRDEDGRPPGAGAAGHGAEDRDSTTGAPA